MNDFTAQLREWQMFYSTVALASVTLAGLLFVSLSLHREAIVGRKKTLMLRLARGSFGDFLYVLMPGLVFLVPHPAPIGLALALFVLGASRGAGLARRAVKAARSGSAQEPAANPVREIGLPAVASLGLMLAGAGVLAGQMAALYGLVIVVAALLCSASWSAWLILVEEDAPGE
jgi:hypothetical protein